MQVILRISNQISNPSDSVTFSQIRICRICRPIFCWIRIWFSFWSDSVFSWINAEVTLIVKIKRVCKRYNIIVFRRNLLQSKTLKIKLSKVLCCTSIVHHQIRIRIRRILIYKICIRRKRVSAGSITFLNLTFHGNSWQGIAFGFMSVILFVCSLVFCFRFFSLILCSISCTRLSCLSFSFRACVMHSASHHAVSEMARYVSTGTVKSAHSLAHISIFFSYACH